MRCEEGAEAGRRLGEPVDLLLQLHDLVAGLAQRLGEALVLGGDGGQRALGVGEPQLEPAGVHRAVGQPAPQVGDLGLEEPQLAPQLLRRARRQPGPIHSLMLTSATSAAWVLCDRPYPRGAAFEGANRDVSAAFAEHRR